MISIDRSVYFFYTRNQVAVQVSWRKAKISRTLNAIMSKVGRIASQEVTLALVKSTFFTNFVTLF